MRRCCEESRKRTGFRCARFVFDDVEVDFERAEVRKAGQRVNMAQKELQLLRYLVDHRERVVTREEVLRKHLGIQQRSHFPHHRRAHRVAAAED